MVLGWFLVRPYPYPEFMAGTTTESDGGEEPGDTSFSPNEATRLIRKNDHEQPLSISGLALMRTFDFWILFWYMSLCE